MPFTLRRTDHYPLLFVSFLPEENSGDGQATTCSHCLEEEECWRWYEEEETKFRLEIHPEF